MKIKFQSKYEQIVFDENGKEIEQPNVISFETDAEYEIFVDEDSQTPIKYHTYHFKDPQNNVSNRIEINDQRVNIFTGVSTLIMHKDQKYVNVFIKADDGTEIKLVTNLHNVTYSEKEIQFDYSLWSETQAKLGHFEVTINVLD